MVTEEFISNTKVYVVPIQTFRADNILDWIYEQNLCSNRDWGVWSSGEIWFRDSKDAVFCYLKWGD